MRKTMSVKKTSIMILLAEALMIAGNVVALSYVDYCYTNLGHIASTTMSATMTVVSIIGFVMALFIGTIIQKTKSRMGKYRMWILVGGLGLVIGSVLMVTTFSANPNVNLIVITAGYLLFNTALDFVCTSKYTLYERMAMGKSDVVDLYNGRGFAGGNLGYTIYSLILLSLVFAIGGENENVGFFGTQILFALLALLGILILLKISKPYDMAASSEENIPQPTAGELFRSLSGNGPAICVTVVGIIKTMCYSLFNFLLVYQCCNVFGDIQYMTIALTMISIVGIIGNLLAPKIVPMLGGRKRTGIVVGIISGILYILLGLFGQSVTAFFLLAGAAVLVQNIYDAIEAVLYLDAGEYWYHKTGNDTRAFLMGMANIGAKIAYALASPILGAVLVMANFSEEALMTGHDAAVMTRATGFLPAAGMLAMALLLAVFHKVSDKQIETCIAENAQKDAALYAEE